MPYESEATSRAFYEALTPAGLAGRTRPEWDEIVLCDLAEMLPPESRILDMGCGYGQLAEPWPADWEERRLPESQLGRHVSEMDHLRPDELLSFTQELATVRRAIETYYRPLKLNPPRSR